MEEGTQLLIPAIRETGAGETENEGEKVTWPFPSMRSFGLRRPMHVAPEESGGGCSQLCATTRNESAGSQGMFQASWQYIHHVAVVRDTAQALRSVTSAEVWQARCSAVW